MSSDENFKVIVLPGAATDIEDLGFEDLTEVFKALEAIGENPWMGHRIRAGDFRPMAYTFEVIKAVVRLQITVAYSVSGDDVRILRVKLTRGPADDPQVSE